ncbi:MAG TPA: cupredoxin domain-containing protein [Thermomicrobiaceae bacterium]|nr:cupredoxin domain-containing protein [Thermomicrobiaceae bacterium]
MLLLIALAGACGTTSGSYGAAASTAPAVRVSLVEFRITPSVTSVPAGPVTFVVSNQGAVTHEMVIVQTDSAPDRLKLSADGDADEDDNGLKVGEVDDVAPGKSATETFRLKSGHYVLFCNQPGHYRMGMATALNVT